jgi:hypothetical protein
VWFSEAFSFLRGIPGAFYGVYQDGLLQLSFLPVKMACVKNGQSKMAKNGLLTIYPTSGSCIFIAGIWIRTDTS